MKKILILTILSAITLLSYAQSDGSIFGKVKSDGDQNVINGATVSLLKASDSSLVKTSIADNEGNFVVDHIASGYFLIMAESVGYAKMYSKALSISSDQSSINMGILHMEKQSTNLSAVVVTSKVPFVQRKIDKMVVNPDALLTNAGTTALEVLEKSPGITVDKDGNISLRGKQGVVVMLDGKPSYMGATDLANYLKGLPSAAIHQIEIMTNPSAKYDAAGNSGVINIITKKNKMVGFNGSLSTSAGAGKYTRTNNSLSLNYRKNKVNLFSTFSQSYRQDFQQLDILRRYLNNDGSTKAIFDQRSMQKKYRFNANAKLGMDFYASDKTTLGVVFTGSYSPNVEKNMNTSFLKDRNEKVDSIATAKGREIELWKNGGINFNVRHQIDTTGSEITADVDYLRYDNNSSLDLVNSSFSPTWNKSGSDHLIGRLPSVIDIFAAKVDYTRPFKNGLKMEAGLKSSFVKTNNLAGYFNDVNGNVKPDYDKTNTFSYKENINAGYLNLSKEIKKWGFQTGLRIENTNYDGNQYGNPTQKDSAFSKSYTTAFPTMYVSYKANDNNSFGLSYGRRVSRPDYEDLNPFLYFIDKYTYSAGNPFLRPSFSNVIELSHSFKQWLNTSINYTQAKDIFSDQFSQEGFATIVRRGNYGTFNQLNLSMNAQLKPAKWWSLNVYVEGRYNQYKGLENDPTFKSSAFNGITNIVNQFKFKKGWSAELSGFVITGEQEGQIDVNPLGKMDIGIAKQVLNNKGNLKLTVSDLLKTNRPDGNIKFQNTEAYFKNFRDSRIVSLTFTYRFGKPIKGLKSRKSGGAGDEQNRVKGS